MNSDIWRTDSAYNGKVYSDHERRSVVKLLLPGGGVGLADASLSKEAIESILVGFDRRVKARRLDALAIVKNPLPVK